jgi:hypothetical protein
MHTFAVIGATPHSFFLGYVITIVVTLVVVALLTPVIVLAFKIGNIATMIDSGLKVAVRNTAPLTGLNDTIESAEVIVDGLYRGRKKLGG